MKDINRNAKKTYKFCVENNIEIDFSYFTEKDNERFFHFDYDYIKKEILGYKISIPKRFYGMASRYSGVQSNEGFRRYVKEKLLSSGLSHEGARLLKFMTVALVMVNLYPKIFIIIPAAVKRSFKLEQRPTESNTPPAFFIFKL